MYPIKSIISIYKLILPVSRVIPDAELLIAPAQTCEFRHRLAHRGLMYTFFAPTSEL
jgi:hypothetical protein